MRFFVTGANGQVGRELVALLEARPQRNQQFFAVDRVQMDLGDRDAVLGAICETEPDVVLHLGAMTAVDQCETNADLAYRINAMGTRHVADACRRVGSHLVYVSTDYVFNGTKDGPYHEWDQPDPRSVYGRSKLGGEAACGPEATVVRTSWVCGRFGQNMVKTVLRLAAGREPGAAPMRFVADQVGHPTFADDLATMLLRLGIDRRPGVFHVTNQGPVSWFGFVQAILGAAGYGPELVEPISTAELQPPRPAPRPANSVLDNAALRLSGVPLLEDFRVPLARLVHELQSDS
ncbi:MAG: dTDP-4-dehydrorhamnose reductase [Acidimicrobiales bacterium]